jgi:predicted enzyme related to lactoylglutathione lyase
LTAQERAEHAEDTGAEPQFAKNGKVSYMQIPAADVDVSAEFYAQVFGWSVRPDTNPTHRSFTDATGEMIGAWVTGRAISREAGVLPFIYVTRIDDTLREVEQAGGATVTPVYAEGELWVATFRDPAGNVMGVWQAGPR